MVKNLFVIQHVNRRHIKTMPRAGKKLATVNFTRFLYYLIFLSSELGCMADKNTKLLHVGTIGDDGEEGYNALGILATIHLLRQKSIDHFTVVCSVTFPLNGSEAGGDFVLIQTSLLLLCKSSCYNANWVLLHDKTRVVCIKARSPSASLSSKARSPSRQQ